MEDLIVIKDLSYTYHSYRKENYVFDEFNISFTKGKVVGLLGPNGSGKSTLIKLMNGLLSPTKGEILIHGHKPGVETKAVVSYLPERTYLQAGKTVKQMLDYFEDFYQDFDKGRARQMLQNRVLMRRHR